MNNLLDVILVLSFVCLIVESVREVVFSKQIEKRKKARKQRELARQIKLQNKIDDFNEFKSRIEDNGYCDENCMNCREFDYIGYINCKYRDSGYQQAKKYFQKRGGAINNIRITLQDYSVADVLELYDMV